MGGHRRDHGGRPCRSLVALVGQRIVFAPGAAHMSNGATGSVGPGFSLCGRADTAWMHLDGWPRVAIRCQAQDPAARRCVSVALPLPKSDTDLQTLREPQRSLAYDRAWWFAQFVAAAYGTAKLRELYIWPTCGVGHSTWLPPPTTSSALTPLACSRAGSGG